MITLIDRDADSCTRFTPAPKRGASEARRLGRAFAAATHGGYDSALAELRVAVEEFVQPMRDAGEPPERVVVALKSSLARYGGLQELIPSTAESAAADHGEVYDRTFRWAVNAYYDKG